MSDAPWPSRIRLILLLVLLPLAVQLGLAVWRMGRDARDGHGDRLLARADSAVATLRSGRAGPQPDSATLEQVLDRLRTEALEPDWLDLDAGPGSPLAPDITARLESLDRPFWIDRRGSITAVSPLEDLDGWDWIGVLLLQSVEQPASLPLAPSLAALAVLAFAALATRMIFRPGPGVDRQAQPDSGSPLERRRTPAGTAASQPRGPGLDRMRPVVVHTALFLPPLAFALWIASLPIPGSPAVVGQHGLWAVVGFAAWLIIAVIGLSLVRVADRPLSAGQAMRAWAFLAPSFIHLLVFSVGPILFALWLSFHEWNLLEPARPFVGLDNYRELAGDADFWRAIRNTAIYVLFVPVGMAVALALALFVNRRIPGVHVMRTIFFLPYITSFVAISLVWRWMFQPDVGLFNNLLGRIGLPPQPWLSSPSSALPSLMLMSVWMYAGYMMVIFLAGLQNIPESLYESAKIDGAGPWRRFLHITLPMLRPTLLFILVTMVIFMFQVFTAVYVMTEGGPLHATDVVVYHVYRAAWEYLRVGYASAMAWVLFAIVFLITLIQFRWLGDRTGVAQ